MKNWMLWVAGGVVCVIGVGYVVFLQQRSVVASPHAVASSLRITSSAFGDGESMPARFTCDGQSALPPLEFVGMPARAQTIAITFEDVDASVGVWDQWVVFNIPATTTAIREGVEPVGVRGRGTAGTRMYSGPCPADKEHHYVFTVYALDAGLTLEEGTTKSELLVAMRGHVLDQAVLHTKYRRTQ